MADLIESFCGTPFWDEQIIWNTTDPDFPVCFQKTVLVWVPCGFMWCLAPLEVFYLLKTENQNIPWSGLNIAKMIISAFLTILMSADIFQLIHLYAVGLDVLAVDFYSSLIKFFTFLLVTIFLYLERRQGLQTTGIIFLFWFLLVLAGLITYRTILKIALDKETLYDEFSFIVQMVYFPLIVAEFILLCMSDALPHFRKIDIGENPSPELNVSFLSRITFSWFDSLIIKGYRKPLEREDMWSLGPEDKSSFIVPVFNKYWKKDQIKHSLNSHALYNGLEVDFELANANRKELSILKALVKSFGISFLSGTFLKIIDDFLIFVNPLVLNLLIKFVSSDEPTWRGYLYASIIFAASFTQALVFNQYSYKMYKIGMNVRSAVISTVYRKAMVLSNSAKRSSTVGEIVNLMSVDAQKCMDVTTYLNLLWSSALQMVIALYLLWGVLGPSVLTGVVIMILLIPINAVIANKARTYQIAQMKNKDQRIKIMNEILNGIKVLKLYAWELPFLERILSIRNKELEILKIISYFNTTNVFIWTCAPFLVMLASFATYVLSDEENVLDASKAFVSLSLFNILRLPMLLLPGMIAILVQGNVSLKRLNKFLNSDELDPHCVQRNCQASAPLIIKNGEFAWESEDEPVLKNINVYVPKNSFTVVVGPVGSGKSSLLSAFLGEMDKRCGEVYSDGKIAYVAQQAWIQNDTLKNNILFNCTYDKKKYDNILDACALIADIKMLPGGDETEIGEKGINLSGGQKQRTSLARAIYVDADLYLLDDPLSAVDSHVGKHIFEHVIGPKGLLKNKTRILVTHNITYLPQADSIIVINNGEISETGSYAELLDKKGAFAEFLMTYLNEDNAQNEDDLVLQEMKQEFISKMGPQIDRRLSSPLNRTLSNTSHSSDKSHSISHQQSLDKSAVNDRKEAKLVTEETSETGQVKFKTYRQYLNSIGLVMGITIVILSVFAQGSFVASNVWLSEWSNDAPSANGTQNTALRDLRLGVYSALGLVQGIFTFTAYLTLAFAGIRASRILHFQILLNILHSPMSFFDTTPLGRIVNRFSKDIDVVDTILPWTWQNWISCFLQVLATLIVISSSTPIFITVIIPVGILYYLVQKFYIPTSRQLRRLESVYRSPIYSHFSESLAGASTIRAYDRIPQFILQSEDKVDENQMYYYASLISNRWLEIRLAFLSNIIVFSAALFAVLSRETMSPGIVGLSLSYALSVTQFLNWLVRSSSDMETNIVAVERIQEYSETPQEAAWEIEELKPLQGWPEYGAITLSDFAVKYRDDLELTLKGISCQINAKEKIGIVGRTGAGKSSLTLALFRIIESTNGVIHIDNIDISKIGLHDLRKSLTIIPQDPVLFSGTLRSNLDPFDTYTDEEVWKSLELSHLKTFVQSLEMKLLHDIAEGGENLSVGQRQLICLSRALLRKTKILILDEATAAVDMETDDLIQATIRQEFADCTVLTIAHRLNTIMDNDRIMVLHEGRIKEFETPTNLLQNNKSIFYGMAKDAGLL